MGEKAQWLISAVLIVVAVRLLWLVMASLFFGKNSQSFQSGMLSLRPGLWGNRPSRWKTLSDQEIVDVIHSRGWQITPEEVTSGYIRGMRNYQEIYTEFNGPILSFMVRIDMQDGINTCSC